MIEDQVRSSDLEVNDDDIVHISHCRANEHPPTERRMCCMTALCGVDISWMERNDSYPNNLIPCPICFQIEREKYAA